MYLLLHKQKSSFLILNLHLFVEFGNLCIFSATITSSEVARKTPGEIRKNIFYIFILMFATHVLL